MFDNLSDKLQRVFKNLRGEGKLSAENMETALREIRMALLEADVNFKVVKQLIENIKQKAVGEEVLNALSPSQQVIKILDTSSTLIAEASPPNRRSTGDRSSSSRSAPVGGRGPSGCGPCAAMTGIRFEWGAECC